MKLFNFKKSSIENKKVATYGELTFIGNKVVTLYKRNFPNAINLPINSNLSNVNIVLGTEGRFFKTELYDKDNIVITCEIPHLLVDNDIITIQGTNYYNGVFKVKVITKDSFIINSKFIDSQSGFYTKGCGLEVLEDGDYIIESILTLSSKELCKGNLYINNVMNNTLSLFRKGILKLYKNDIVWLSLVGDSDNTDIYINGYQLILLKIN